MTRYLETARQIVDDEASFDPCNRPREVMTLVRVHKSLAQLEIQRTEAEAVDGEDHERIYFGDGV